MEDYKEYLTTRKYNMDDLQYPEDIYGSYHHVIPPGGVYGSYHHVVPTGGEIRKPTYTTNIRRKYVEYATYDTNNNKHLNN